MTFFQASKKNISFRIWFSWKSSSVRHLNSRYWIAWGRWQLLQNRGAGDREGWYAKHRPMNLLNVPEAKQLDFIVILHWTAETVLNFHSSTADWENKNKIKNLLFKNKIKNLKILPRNSERSLKLCLKFSKLCLKFSKYKQLVICHHDWEDHVLFYSEQPHQKVCFGSYVQKPDTEIPEPKPTHCN